MLRDTLPQPQAGASTSALNPAGAGFGAGSGQGREAVRDTLPMIMLNIVYLLDHTYWRQS